MKISFSLFAALIFFGACATKPAYVTHPEPKDPVYVSKSIYESLKTQMPPAPEKDSAIQKQDETKLVSVQKTRTELDCKRAATEVIINLQAFYGKPFGPLDENTAKKMEPFFEKLRNETNYFTQKLKKDFPRTRPFEYIAGLEPCVLREHSLSYPSGHAAIAELFALTLDDLYPKQKSEFDHRAQQIGDDRVVAGMHHPSDVAAGRKFADLLYAEIKKSPAFQADLKEAQQK